MGGGTGVAPEDGTGGFERAVIFGAGALGSYLGARLAPVVPVTVVVRPAAVRTLRRRGLVVAGREELHVPPQSLTVATRPPHLPPASLVVVGVKLYDLAEAGRLLAPVAGADTTFLLIQNGLVARELFLAACGRPLRVVRAVASIGAELVSAGRVVYAGGGLVLEPGAASHQLLRLFERAGVACSESPDFPRALWKKLAVNCIANPLTALLGVRNCDIVISELEPVRRALGAEVAALAAAEGHPLPSDWLARIDENLRASSNRSSMLQDLERGRPTEIEFLNGFVARRAAELGLEAPVNATLAALVRSAAAQRRRAGERGR